MTVLIKVIKEVAVIQALLLLLWPISFELFMNIEVAFFSAFFILLGSMYSYARLVQKRVEHFGGADERDAIDKIEDPYDLYDEEHEEVDPEHVDLKALVKEEKARIKATGSVKNMRKTAPAMVSLYRLIPYGMLILGFIGLKNNDILELWPYLIGLGLGILAGLLAGRRVFVSSVQA